MDENGAPRNPEVRVFSDLQTLSQSLAESLVESIQTTVEETGRYSLILSGGSTPRMLYQLLADEYEDLIPWSDLHLFWGDERCVPPDHPDSNYGMALRMLIAPSPIPSRNVHRMPSEVRPPDTAAREYEDTLRDFFTPDREGAEPDCILLGVGEDGHTASLYPGHEVLEETTRWTRAVSDLPPEFDHSRITLTLPFINSVRRSVFLVSGRRKRDVVRTLLRGTPKQRRALPAGRVNTAEGPEWYLDRAADPSREDEA